MPTAALTDKRLRGLRREDGEIIDVKSGLSARADSEGKVSLTYRYRLGKTRPRIFIGHFPQTALADARIEAGKIRELVRKGRDPQADRRAGAAAASMSFDELADLYLTRYAMKSKSSWKADARHLRVDVSPIWGKRPAASITRQDAVKLLFDVAEHAPVGANRLRTVLGKLFSWTVDAGLLETNPMLGVHKPTVEGRGRTRVLDDREIRVLWRAFDSANSRPGVLAALKVLLLLGQRPGEVKDMVTDELHDLADAERALWIVPAWRMKARRAHVVPLPPLAREIIRAQLAQPRRSERVFAGGADKLGIHALSNALSGIIDGLGDEGASLRADRPTPHDFRRSAISGMSRLGVPRDHRMAVAAHSYSDTHEVYDRHDFIDEKRAALTRWEAHVRKVVV